MATYAADQAKAERFVTPKDPSDVVPYSVDFSADIASGDSVSSQTVTPETGLTLDASSESAGVITGVFSGGTAGKNYDVTWQVVTTNGYTLNYSTIIRVANR